jgi:hypothetical protein
MEILRNLLLKITTSGPKYQFDRRVNNAAASAKVASGRQGQTYTFLIFADADSKKLKRYRFDPIRDPV